MPHERLTPQEERDLAARYQSTKDPKILDRFMLANDGLAWMMARRWSGVVDIEDAVQEARIGLRIAAERYDGSARFSTFAVWYLRSAVSRYVHSMSTPVHMNHGASGALLTREPMIRAKIEARGEEATDLAIAREAGTTVANLLTVRAMRGGGVRLDAQAAVFEDGESLHGVIADPRRDPEAEMAAALDGQRVRAALEAMPPRLRHILQQFADHDMTDAETARQIGLSRERVRQLKELALAKLRANMTKRNGTTEPDAEEPRTHYRGPTTIVVADSGTTPWGETGNIKLADDGHWVSRSEARDITGLGVCRLNQLVRGGVFPVRMTEAGREFERAALDRHMALARAPELAVPVVARTVQPRSGTWIDIRSATEVMHCTRARVHQLARKGLIESRPLVGCARTLEYGAESIESYRASRTRVNNNEMLDGKPIRQIADSGSSECQTATSRHRQIAKTAIVDAGALMTKAEVMARLSCSAWNVLNLVRRRDLIPVKVNGAAMYRASEVEVYATRPRHVKASAARRQSKTLPSNGEQLVEAAREIVAARRAEELAEEAVTAARRRAVAAKAAFNEIMKRFA